MSFQRPFLISLKRDSEQPWGFRLIGGKDKDEPHIVQKVAPDSLAENCGLREGDELIQIGRINVQDLSHGQVEEVVLKCRNRLEMFVIREDIFQPRKGQNEPQKIKAVVHAQYNSPMGLYSSQNIADTLGQTAEYVLGDPDQRRTQSHPSYDEYQRHVNYVQTQSTPQQSYTQQQQALTSAHPGVQQQQYQQQQQQQYQSKFVMNNTQPFRPVPQTHDNRVTTSYYQQQQPYDRQVTSGYTQQQFQNKTSVHRVDQTHQQRFEKEYPQVPQSAKRVEFASQPMVGDERRVGFADYSQAMRTEKQMHQHAIQQEREYNQRPQSPRTVQQTHRHVIQNEHEYSKRPQSPKSILRSDQPRAHLEREHRQRPQSPRPMMRTEEEEDYKRKPVQERAAAYQEMVQTQDQAQHRGTPYERQVSTSTVQLKQVSSPDVRSDHQVHHQRPQSPRPTMKTEDIHQRKAVQERATAYQGMVQSHDQAHASEQRMQHRGTPYERQVSTSTVQLKQVSSPTPDRRSEQVHQQRPQQPPSPKVTMRSTMQMSPSPTISPSTTPNTTRKRMEAVWPPRASNVKPMPKTGFNTTSSGKQLIWPPSKSDWESDGSWPPSGRQTPQSPTLSRKMVNAWNPSPSPPPMRRVVASPVAARKAIWPPPSRSPERASHFQPINKPHRKTGKFDDYIQHHASCGVPVTYRPPPSVQQHIEVNY